MANSSIKKQPKKKTVTNKDNFAGIGNHINHQLIISDLIFGIRKKFARENIDDYYVLSEISLSELGYQKNNFSHNHNIDLVIAKKGANKKEIHFLLEIEKSEQTKNDTEKKVEECLKKIKTIEESFIVRFNKVGKIAFYKCSIKNNKMIQKKASSQSGFLNMALKRSLVSLK